VLDDAIGELSDVDREAVLLRYFEGRDFSSVGAKLNLTGNAARMRVERALEKLRTRLERRGITSTTAVLATVLTQQTLVATPAGLAASVTTAALAGGVGTGVGALAAFGFMTKAQMGIVTALVGAGATGFVLQSQHGASLRLEVERLQQQTQEIAALRTEHQRLENVAAEIAGLRQDEAELGRLRDEAAALQESVRKVARLRAGQSSDRAMATTVPSHTITEKTSAAFRNLKPLQDAKDWAGMIRLLDGLMSQVEPTSYDMALILDMKAKLYAQQNQLTNAIEPWEKALQLSDQFKYFDDKRSADIVHFLAQIRLQASGVMAEAPQALWF
jgi:cell division protein FtsB